jgi:hypothetical protein
MYVHLAKKISVYIQSKQMNKKNPETILYMNKKKRKEKKREQKPK